MTGLSGLSSTKGGIDVGRDDKTGNGYLTL